MNGLEFSELRCAMEMTQEEIGKRLGVSRMTVMRWESGKSPIPEPVSVTIQAMSQTSDEVEEIVPEEVPSDVPSLSFDPTKLGLRRYPLDPPFSYERDWDAAPVRKGWRRIEGTWRVVSDKVPDPVPYEPPQWAGWRGVVSADGRVFDYETAAEMKDYRAGPAIATPFMSRLKKDRGSR